jgi:hypothetical protein
MLHYTTTLHPDLSFLLMERIPKSLQQMFNDAQEIQHNILACKQIQKEELDTKEHESEYEQKTIDWNFEHRVDNIVGPLEVFNADDFPKDCIPLIEKGGANLAFDPSHDEHGADCFIYSFVDSQEDEIAYVVDFPIYD